MHQPGALGGLEWSCFPRHPWCRGPCGAHRRPSGDMLQWRQQGAGVQPERSDPESIAAVPGTSRLQAEERVWVGGDLVATRTISHSAGFPHLGFSHCARRGQGWVRGIQSEALGPSPAGSRTRAQVVLWQLGPSCPPASRCPPQLASRPRCHPPPHDTAESETRPAPAGWDPMPARCFPIPGGGWGEDGWAGHQLVQGVPLQPKGAAVPLPIPGSLVPTAF